MVGGLPSGGQRRGAGTKLRRAIRGLLRKEPATIRFTPAAGATAKPMGWGDLADRPVALLEGGGRFTKFVHERSREAGVKLDVALECSSSNQVIDAVRHCGCVGFVRAQLKDMLPDGVAMGSLDGLEGYEERLSVAWRKSERENNPAVDRVVRIFTGSRLKNPTRRR